ncbi:MAG TPA: hypothetical protein VGZ48_13540 [Candidatus Acidoferrales bacterium]|jgi:hypothetical protein|nr:hypothetical protein [Candidatus Acidoferrales bacterium]
MTPRQARTVLVGGFLTLAGLALISFHLPTKALAGPRSANSRAHAQYGPYHAKIKSFTVTMPDDTLNYPSSLDNLPDEHTTFIPLFGPHDFPPAPGGYFGNYLVFGSGSISGNGGTVVLETSDLKNFDFASNLGYSDQVMNPPVAITICNPTYDKEFDENYSAPGTIVQNPAGPPGNFFMLYEAENHCPGGDWQEPYYATVGFARSSDYGRTWPGPANSVFGNRDRHPVLVGPNPEPTSKPKPPSANMGDGLPSAFLDRNYKNENYIYVTYGYSVGPGNGTNDGLVRVARAKAGDGGPYHRDGDDNPLSFVKWFSGAFSQPGIGGQDTGPVPASGCPGIQEMSEINYNDDLGLYLMIFVCDSFQEDGYGAWYYSTATSLDLQDWTLPQLIENSRFKILKPCPISGSGTQFDGFHPSFMSPGAAQGHTRLTGKVFFLNGCNTGLPRIFASRTFTITVE